MLLASVAPAQRTGQVHNMPRTWAQEMVSRLANRLGLSEPQKQQALVVYMNVEESSRPLERKITEQRRALREAIKNNASESQIEQISALLGSLIGQLTAIETKGESSFYGLLSPEQRRKWDQPFRGPGRGPAGRPPDQR
jgi:hypothetical protein